MQGCESEHNTGGAATGCDPGGGDVATIELNRPLADAEAVVVQVLIDDSKICGSPSYADGQLTCTLPSGTGPNHLVQVKFAGNTQSDSNVYVGVSYRGCDEGYGRLNPSVSLACSRCPAGTFSKDESCNPCADGTYSRGGTAECAICPDTPGVSCDDGVLQPQNGFWSSAQATGDAQAEFNRDTVFQCLMEGACLKAANVSADVTPRDAYVCKEGHEGVLCGACSDGFFQQKDECKSCEGASISSGTLMAFGGCVAAALVLLVYQFRIRKRSNDLIATLHVLKRELAKRQRSFATGTIGGDARTRKRQGAITRRLTSLTLQGMKVVHHSVHAAKRGKYGFGESLRILLNASEVTAHLCT